MIAMKVNWFQTNIQVGQGCATHFITKVVSTTYPWMSASGSYITESAKNSVWEVEHWVSTHLAFNIMGIRTGYSMCGHNSRSPMSKTILGDDMKVQWDTIPVGMAKIALVYATMSLHHSNQMWLTAFGVTQVQECVSNFRQFLNKVAAFKELKKVNPRCRNHKGRILYQNQDCRRGSHPWPH